REDPLKQPHIVVVLVDQLRMDSMERWAPNMTALGKRGVSATHMRSVAPWTYPSVLSLFSGLYPQQHGADGEHDSNQLRIFDPDVVLFHEILQDNGYETAAFVTNPFLHNWNSFHEGFDTFDIHFIGNSHGVRGKPKKVWGPDMFADTVNMSIKDHFLERPVEDPEFTYVHYIDVHGPWGNAPFPGTYEDSIAWIDEKILELYEFMSDRYDGDVLFFVTSDHGQALDDDEDIGVGPDWRANKHSVFDFNLRIPFLLLPSNLVTEPRVLTAPCSNVDVLPTLLDWLDLDAPVPLPGVSLLPSIQDGATLSQDRLLYSRTSAFGSSSDCIVRGDRKSMRFFDPRSNVKLDQSSYDLLADPRETETLGEDHWGFASEFIEAAGPHGVAFRPVLENLDPKVQEALQELGYLK
ncbi:MAG: sulfatase-like hydrolase/transferase, partial [Planctomycetota bacterium]|nr:sulfatase-like hydrolase/transferase [Planctomycetota bacterium]